MPKVLGSTTGGLSVGSGPLAGLPTNAAGIGLGDCSAGSDSTAAR